MHCRWISSLSLKAESHTVAWFLFALQHFNNCVNLGVLQRLDDPINSVVFQRLNNRVTRYLALSRFNSLSTRQDHNIRA